MVNIIRKVTLLMINVFIPDTYIFYKAICGIMFLLMYLRLQEKLKPFKNEVFNVLEQREILCTLTTIFLGIIFIQSGEDAVIFSLIAAAVLAFFQMYFYLMICWTFVGLK